MSSAGILTTVVVAVGSNELKRVVGGKGFDVHPVIAGFVLGGCLYGIASVNEDIASKFCVLIIIGALLINGAAIFNLVTPKATGGAGGGGGGPAQKLK